MLGAHVGELLAQRRPLRVGALELLAQPLALGFGPLGLGLGPLEGRAQLRELGLQAIEPLGLLGIRGGLRRRRVRHGLGRLRDGLGLRRAAVGLAQLGDLGAQLGQLGAQPVVGRARLGGAALAAPRGRQVDDQAAPHLQLGRLDVRRAVGPGERRPPRLAALAGELPARERRQAPAPAVGLDGQHRPRHPAARQPLPVAGDLEPVVRDPLEALQLERQLPRLRHQRFFPPSSGRASVAVVSPGLATGAPVSVGGGR